MVQKTLDPPSALTYGGRSLGYWATSVLSMISGYLLSHGNNIDQQTAFHIAGLALGSIPFFLVYAILFHYPDRANVVDPRALYNTQRDAIFLISALFFVIGGICLSKSNHSISMVISASCYILLFFSYAIYLFKKYRDDLAPPIRNRLVWPVTLSISISMYYGFFLKEFSSFAVYYPILILVLWYFFSSRLSKRVFVMTSVILITIAVLTMLTIVVDQYLSTCLLSLAIGAYLAVFEAWRIVAYLGISQMPAQLISQYHRAVLAAASLSGLFMPAIYIFSKFDNIFYWGFLAHCILAFFLWFNYGEDIHRNWVGWKLGFGSVFLGILVIDSIFSSAVQKAWIPRLYSLATIGIMASLWFIFLLPSLKSEIEKSSRIVLIFNNKDNFLRVISVICIFCCLILWISGDFQEASEPVRCQNVFLFYVIIFTLCMIHFLVRYLLKKSPSMQLNSATNILKEKENSIKLKVSGFIRLIRMPTCLAINAVVFVPALLCGHPWTTSLWLGLPFAFAAAGGFALNDCLDVKQDCLNKPYRALPSKCITRDFALSAAKILLCLALAVSLFSGIPIWAMSLYFAAILGVIIYNYIVRRITIAKVFVAAIISSLPIIFVVTLFQYRLIYLLLPIIVFLFLVGREILMDIRDMKGDQEAGLHTFPLLCGEKKSRNYAAVFMALSLSIFVFINLDLRGSESWYLFMGTICSTVILLLCWTYNVFSRRAIIGYLWIPIILISGMLII